MSAEYTTLSPEHEEYRRAQIAHLSVSRAALVYTPDTRGRKAGPCGN
ncbi:hypothetical protein SALBM311S_04470 [Streptomyces alboniger]